MMLAFHHPGIVVPDLDAAARFYTEALEFEVLRSFDWDRSESDVGERVMGLAGTAAKCLLLKGNNCFLELFQYLSPASEGDPASRRACDYGVAHLAFQVDDIEAAYDRLIAAGGTAHGPPAAVGEGYSLYCRDPFGNIVELMQLGDDEADFDLVKENLLPGSRR